MTHHGTKKTSREDNNTKCFDSFIFRMWRFVVSVHCSTEIHILIFSSPISVIIMVLMWVDCCIISVIILAILRFFELIGILYGEDRFQNDILNYFCNKFFGYLLEKTISQIPRIPKKRRKRSVTFIRIQPDRACKKRINYT